MSRWPVLLVFPLVLSACTIHHRPKDFELDEPWPALAVSGPVDVRAGDALPGMRSIALAGQTFTLDLSEYTDALVERVAEALAAQGTPPRDGAGKSVELEVVYANILPGAGPSHCVVDFTLRTANGYVRGLQARAVSYDPQKACNAALSKAALACLRDDGLQAYLSS